MPEVNEHDATPSPARNNIEYNSPMIPSTPAAAGRIQPPRSEMHPSQARAHHSTKKEDTGINLGFSDIGTSRPEPLTTPSKISMPPQSEFDFRFARPTESLGPEAKQMMAEIREEAQRIKAELQAKHEEEKAKNGDGTSSILGGRKLAQPKSKAGRYSELHMNEFKKMDSIADHPSSFRAQPGRVPTATFSENKKSLKRTQSRADLGDDNQRAAKSTIKVVSETTSSRLENPFSSKRPRGLDAKDTSSYTKDVPSKIPSKPSTPSVSRTSKFLDMITTPTQSSLARSNSNNQLNGTPAKILQRSPSKIQMTPGMVKSATTSNLNNFTSPAKPESTHRFADKMKSILRRGGQEQRKMAPPPSNIPTMSKSPSRPNLNKELPTVPTTPSTSHLPRSKSMKSIKQVSFTPATIAKDIAQQSPTPIKSGLPRSKSNVNLNSVAYPTLPSPSKPVERSLKKQPGRFFVRPTGKMTESIVGLDVEKTVEQDVEMTVSPTLEPASERAAKESESTIEYPDLPEIIEKSPSSSPSSSPIREFAQPLSVPGLFTFTHGTQIKFGTPPRNNFGKNSPAAASIRKVRESLFSAPTDTMPGAFPGSNNKENRIPLEVPAIAHGFSNKKRARAASPSDDLVRSGDTGDYDKAEADRSPKKRKQVAAEGDMLVAPKLVAAKAAREAKAPRSLIPSPAKAAATAAANARANSKSPVKKGGLTMSRLQALAAPKRRV